MPPGTKMSRVCVLIFGNDAAQKDAGVKGDEFFSFATKTFCYKKHLMSKLLAGCLSDPRHEAEHGFLVEEPLNFVLQKM